MELSRRLRGAAPMAALPAAVTLAAILPATQAQAQAQMRVPAAQLRVLSPRAGETIGANSFFLDVEFKSLSRSPIVTAELWVDGVRWVRRDLDTPRLRSTLSFEVDATTLAGGSHTVLVRVFNAAGGVATAQLPVNAGSDEGVVERMAGGPAVNFLAPGNGKRISGIVELNLDATGPAGQNPYVSIYVDKQFKTLKNYPPYSYTWDTTQVPNGYHTIEAIGYLDSGNATTTRRLRVYVDNAGGNTARMEDIPDLSEARRETEGAPTTSIARAASGRTLTIPVAKSARAGAVKPATPTLLPPVGAAKLTAYAVPLAETAAPATLGLAATPTSPARSAVVDVKMAVPQVGLTSVAPKADAGVATEIAPLSAPAVAKTAVPSLAAPRLAAPKAPAVVSSKPTVAAVAATPKAPVSLAPAKATVMAKTTRVAVGPKTTAAAPRVRPAGISEFAPTPDVTKGLQVAFDGQRIAFDVQPRVEAGMPIAPFRQIFEHTGGQVTWAAETRTVRAVNADREVVIPVGRTTATVNGESISMERAAFLERGRTIVPLSFVGKALDVEINYDPQTGRLQINSKK